MILGLSHICADIQAILKGSQTMKLHYDQTIEVIFLSAGHGKVLLLNVLLLLNVATHHGNGISQQIL